MTCPFCGSTVIYVLRKTWQPNKRSDRRRYQCQCRRRFWTREMLDRDKQPSSAWATKDCSAGPQRTTPGIYFVQWRAYIKIGYANNIRARREGIEAGIPEDQVTVLGWIPCEGGNRVAARQEEQIHRELSAHRVRGEWFHDNAGVRAFIERHAVTWDQDEARNYARYSAESARPPPPLAPIGRKLGLTYVICGRSH